MAWWQGAGSVLVPHTEEQSVCTNRSVVVGVLVLAGVVAFLVYRQRKKAGDRNAHDARENAMRMVEEDSDDSSSLRSDVSLTHTESESSF